jgi:1,4-dihydroxy-2-naphthoate polyprenyltransferase
MATTTEWVAGARLRTLPLAVAPVIIGTGAAIGWQRHWSIGAEGLFGGSQDAELPWWQLAVRAVLALIVSLALQVAVNYANDYSDGIRGTDDDRVGPFRLTGSRAATPSQVKNAAFAAFGVAAVAGLVLVALSGKWWLLLVGVACVLAAWYYTGGKKPYGYAGFGEIAVFVFFGLVAVLGTTYTQIGTVTWPAVGGAVAIGSLACAVLVVNNLRDIPTDTESGKITLAVRLGDDGSRRFYLFLLAVPFLAALLIVATRPWAALALLSIPLAVAPARVVSDDAKGLALLPVLAETGRLALIFALLLGVGLAI